MKRLILKADDLCVESFEAGAPALDARGLVRGAVYTYTCGAIPAREGEMEAFTYAGCCV